MSQIAELAVPYAIMLLHDDEVDITEENVTKVLEASGITVEPIWVKVFVKSAAGQDLRKFLSNITAGVGSAPAAAPAAGAPAAGATAAAGKKEEKKKEESEEEEMGFGLFD
ncbi:60S acidic ribosomal protein P1 [Paramicrosporidium saccamoebae]|uniref:60S acidic ribosomal protein P1 n=1 Tax=Paramicrosporidium saccamoebae TaxID=1246581 RepID=A0A2H9TNQ7_9FUNG|nr:60S acidic ribosomal protein P1 [Paramicrosporidium saccamoebae]